MCKLPVYHNVELVYIFQITTYIQIRMDFVEVTSRKRKRRLSDSRSKLSNHIQTTIEKLFEKNFRYMYGEKDDSKFEINFQKKQQLSEEWAIKEYISMKDELNTLKNNLNDKNMITWHDHTRRVNLAGNAAQEIRSRARPELCTQAWCKFYEIASKFLKVENTGSLVTVHLCEAPGAFITSLNHYLFTHSDREYTIVFKMFGAISFQKHLFCQNHFRVHLVIYQTMV